jgi:hypothetical protein
MFRDFAASPLVPPDRGKAPIGSSAKFVVMSCLVKPGKLSFPFARLHARYYWAIGSEQVLIVEGVSGKNGLGLKQRFAGLVLDTLSVMQA